MARRLPGLVPARDPEELPWTGNPLDDGPAVLPVTWGHGATSLLCLRYTSAIRAASGGPAAGNAAPISVMKSRAEPGLQMPRTRTGRSPGLRNVCLVPRGASTRLPGRAGRGSDRPVTKSNSPSST